MKTFSVREQLLGEGKDAQVTQRKRVIARLAPEPVNPPSRLPDFRAQILKRV
jgi:hypothetical protein